MSSQNNSKPLSSSKDKEEKRILSDQIINARAAETQARNALKEATKVVRELEEKMMFLAISDTSGKEIVALPQNASLLFLKMFPNLLHDFQNLNIRRKRIM